MVVTALSSGFSLAPGTFDVGTIGVPPSSTATFTFNGPISLSGGPNTITNSIFSGITNTTSPGGGAISINSGGSATIINSSFSGNMVSGGHAPQAGGAILINPGGTATIANSSFEKNMAPNGFAGAIENGGTATITNSNFIENTASDHAGAIANDGTAMITNSSFENNTSERAGAIDDTPPRVLDDHQQQILG